VNGIVDRKDDHIKVFLEADVRSAVDSGFSRYRFEHNALPEIDFSKIDISMKFFGRRINMPLIISSITGGGHRSEKINKGLAEIAHDFNLGIAVGSQRPAIEDRSRETSFKIRNYAPNILLFANLGAVQLNYGYSLDECRRAVEMIDADALILHLNPLQEVFQPGGNTGFAGLLGKIEKICAGLQAPVVVKEVGYGISSPVAKKLLDVGVAVIDVAGAGNISWGAIEGYRSNDIVVRNCSRTFSSWGNPTAECVRSIAKNVKGIKIIASGGVETGVDVAKSIALGADICGNASGFLRHIAESRAACENFVESVMLELKTAMFCIGCKNIQELKSAKLRRAGDELVL
jgi:isopentenyl-diphosphate delta-isomerase